MPEPFVPRIVDENGQPFIPRVVGEDNKVVSIPPSRRNEGMQGARPAIQTPEEQTNPNTVAFREFVGKPAVEALPIAGSYFGLPGTGIGASLKQAAKSGAPSLFGSANGSGIEDAATDVAVNSIIPSFLTKGLGTASKLFSQEGRDSIKAALASRIYKMTGNPSIGDAIAKSESAAGSKKFVYPQSQILDTLAENNAQQGRYAYPQSFNSVSDKLKELQSGKIKYNDVGKFILEDISKVRESNLIDPTATRQLANNELLNSSYKGSTGTFDANAALDILRGDKNEIYKEAMGKNGYNSIEGFLTDLQKTEGPAKGGLKALNYVANRFTLGLGGIGFGLLTGGVPGAAMAAGGAGTILLGNKALKMLVDNPDVANLARQMLKTPAEDPLSPILKRAFMNSIRGSEVVLKIPGDKDQKAIIGSDGQLQSPVPMR